MFDEQPSDDGLRTLGEMDFLPFDEGSAAEDQVTRRVDPIDPGQFLYLGQGLTADEFTAYVERYDFGTIPPDYVVLHHTANPCTLYARYPAGSAWDGNEGGLSEAQIKQRRLGKLTAIKEYYRTNPNYLWDRGPHLFIDDRYVWLFTPMRHIGIHAAQGNSYTRDGRLHYSIGIEVLGYYENVEWPTPVAQLVGHVVAVLKRRLGTFELRYQRFAGGISSHRDYNKPQCPGRAITEDFYIRVLNEGWHRLTSPVTPAAVLNPVMPAAVLNPVMPAAVLNPVMPAAVLSLDSPILGPASGSAEQVIAFVKAQLPPDSEYRNDVEKIVGYYWQYAPPVGVDPFLAAAQMIFETDALRSHWAARPRRNPAGLGVRQEGGLSFASWEAAVQAQLGQLLALALPVDQASQAQREMIARNPRNGHIAPELRGSAPTVRDLSHRWTNDPAYAQKFVARAQAIRDA